MRPTLASLAATLTLATTLLPPPGAAADVAVLNAVGSLPAPLIAGFVAPIGFVEYSTGEQLVLDRRAHTVYTVDAARTRARELIKIGFEQGKLLEPGVLALGAGDTFAVSDAPAGTERIQYFTSRGSWIGGFYLPSTVMPRLVIDGVVMNGAGAMQFLDRGFLVNQPESGSLIAELDLKGYVVRRFGRLRETGHERDPDLHLALNVGLPVAAADGGVYFVFRTGTPLFRKYDAAGDLVFERHIEGPELDQALQALPTVWPTRPAGEGRYPIVPPLVRTAAVDRAGRLWISLVEPYTYVYDAAGRPVRTVQFKGAGVLSPATMFFTSHDTVLVTPGCYEFAVK